MRAKYRPISLQYACGAMRGSLHEKDSTATRAKLMLTWQLTKSIYDSVFAAVFDGATAVDSTPQSMV
jgi:hypothetical protein